MTNDAAARFFPSRAEALGPEDFETASIRSAAPSYVSDAPSYHSTVPVSEAIPPYSPPENRGTTAGAASGSSSTPAASASHEGSDLVRSRTPRPDANPRSSTPQAPGQSQAHPYGLPPLPPLAQGAQHVPNLNQFRIPTWSTISSNPTARHYHSVAQRRVERDADPSGTLRQFILKQVIDHEEGLQSRAFRPLEDPYLVGEEAARQARAERLARENGDDILLREDRRWDGFLTQMKDWEERQRTWARFRRDMESTGPRVKLAGRLGGRLML